MSSLPEKLRLALCGVVCAGMTVACSSNPPAGQPVSENVHNIGGENVYRWWDNPGDVGDTMAAVGISPRTANLGMSRTAAEVDGRAKLAAILDAEVQQLVENWAQDTGDLAQPDSLQSLFNNEAFTRQVVDTHIRGARVAMYHQDDSNVYALMVLSDPNTFVDNLVAEVEERTLQDDTYFKTEVRKGDARARLDALADKEKEEIAAKRQGFRGPPLSD